MIKAIPTLTFLLLLGTAFSQKTKPFSGKLIYSIEIADTAMAILFPKTYMTIYTNDTIVRIENETKNLGTQVVLKHSLLNKSILMLNVNNKGYAIQTDLSKHDKKQDTSFYYKKKWGRIKIFGQVAKKIEVIETGHKKGNIFFYLKDYSTKYVDAYSDLPGLPVYYMLTTSDGTFIYTLIHMEETTVDANLFGVPSDYSKMTFDEFLDEILNTNEEKQEE
jgi:hypothetical protein